MISDRIRTLARDIGQAFPFLEQRAAPGFEETKRRAAEVWSTVDPGLKGETGRLLRNMDRFVAAAWLVYLEATPGGLTVARIHTLGKALGTGGLGMARASIAYLRYIRYIEPLPREGDARLQRYRTSDTLRAVFRERFRQEFELGRRLHPAVAELEPRLGDDAHFNAYLMAMTELSLAMLRDTPRRHNPVDMFWRRASGIIVLCDLIRRGEPDDVFPSRGPLTYSVKDIARRCGTSRMQVQRLLDDARAEGHLVQLPDGRDRLSDALREGFERLVAMLTLMQAGAARVALDTIEGARAPA